MTFRFKVSSFRNQYEASDGRRLCVFTAPVSELPVEWEDWREINVRDTKKRSDVFNAIVDTLRNDPGEMIFRNLGITIVSPAVEFDNKSNVVEIDFSDKARHGIANGGHTFSAIQHALLAGPVDAQVKVECIVGEVDPKWLVDIVDGRNRSRPVQEESLENLAKSYDSIKGVLANPLYKDRIAYSEFELDDKNKRRDISIREILSYIYCLDDFDKNSHPIDAYSSKGAVVDYYAAEDGMGKKRHTYILERASKILPKVLELRDVIYRDLPRAYNAVGGSFGKLKTMGVATHEDNPRSLRFMDGVTVFSYPDAFVYPILAAFRKYIDHRGWLWKEDPLGVWERKKNDIAAAMKDAVKDSASANKMGKAGITWRVCYDAL
ncbi:MAG: AIPR family protein [Candidatus Liptonbacteria bacterium]|nr:AIPR family protein [Candidatus Liptonbacteria bacterium]